MDENVRVNQSPQPKTAPAVLVIDDDEIMRELLGDWLEAAGYRVSKAAQCGEALEALKRERPAVVVTDMWMPGPCAEEAIAELKQALPGIAIVAVSGHFNSGHRVCAQAAIAAGASRALAKPVQRAEFLKAIAELAGPPGRQPG